MMMTTHAHVCVAGTCHGLQVLQPFARKLSYNLLDLGVEVGRCCRRAGRRCLPVLHRCIQEHDHDHIATLKKTVGQPWKNLQAHAWPHHPCFRPDPNTIHYHMQTSTGLTCCGSFLSSFLQVHCLLQLHSLGTIRQHAS